MNNLKPTRESYRFTILKMDENGMMGEQPVEEKYVLYRNIKPKEFIEGLECEYALIHRAGKEELRSYVMSWTAITINKEEAETFRDTFTNKADFLTRYRIRVT